MKTDAALTRTAVRTCSPIPANGRAHIVRHRGCHVRSNRWFRGAFPCAFPCHPTPKPFRPSTAAGNRSDPAHTFPPRLCRVKSRPRAWGRQCVQGSRPHFDPPPVKRVETGAVKCLLRRAEALRFDRSCARRPFRFLLEEPLQFINDAGPNGDSSSSRTALRYGASLSSKCLGRSGPADATEAAIEATRHAVQERSKVHRCRSCDQESKDGFVRPQQAQSAACRGRIEP